MDNIPFLSKKPLIIFLLLIFLPLSASAIRYLWFGDGRANWQTADRSSAGLLPPASSNPDAIIMVFAARTVRWRSIFAVHTWIVVKEQDAATYSRYDYTAWGDPIRTNGFAPDGRWFGAMPETVVAVDGSPRKRSFHGYGTSSKIIGFERTGIIALGPGLTRIHSFALHWTLFRNFELSCRRPRSARTFPMMADGSAQLRRAPAFTFRSPVTSA